jgi:hypothetical protein
MNIDKAKILNMKNTLSVLILLLLLTNCNNSRKEKDIETNIGLEEEFAIRGFNVGVEIYLFPDFTFLNRFYSRACTGGFFIKNVTGTYMLEENNVIFSPQTMIIMEDWESHEITNTTKIDTVEYYVSDSTKIQTEYRIVENSNIKFLVSESSVNEFDDIFYRNSNFIALANLYNSYEHVKTTERLLANKDTTICFRNLDIEKNIPTEWQDYFLEEPIQAEITSVRVVSIPIKFREMEVGYSLIPNYRLNIGVQSRIKEGMILYSQKRKEVEVRVKSVEENKTIAEGEDIFYFDTRFKTGTILSTKKE